MATVSHYVEERFADASNGLFVAVNEALESVLSPSKIVGSGSKPLKSVSRSGMDPHQFHFVYEFGDFQVDALRRVVTARGDGQVLPLTGRAFDTLLYFVERPGELLEKRTIMEALWPRVVVEDANLTQMVHTLRRGLGERPDDHRYIVTVPGRGYRFVAPVTRRAIEAVESVDEPRAQPPAAAAYSRRWGVLGATLSAVLAIGAVMVWTVVGDRQGPDQALKPAIAVLPFADMSPGGDQEYFSDGLAEEILNELAQSTAVRVIARTSSFSFRNQDADIATIADRLAVTHVLEGSVRKAGDRIRITAQLVDGTTSEHIWSQIYDRETRDVFGVQSEIAAAVADALHVTLTGRDRPTHSAQAFEHFLKGRYFLNRRSPDDLERSRRSFEAALRVEPTYASAWLGLAAVYTITAEGRVATRGAVQHWREAVERGLALRPDSAEAQARAAKFYWYIGEVRTAHVHFERARTLNASDPLVLGTAAGMAVFDGRLGDAIAVQRRIVEIDPISPVARSNLAVFLMGVREWDAAREELEAALTLSAEFLGARVELAKVLIVQNRLTEALDIARDLPEGSERDYCLALIYGASGDERGREESLSRLIVLAESSDPAGLTSLSVAEVYAFGGETDLAFDWLTRASQAGSGHDLLGPSWRSTVEMRLSPFLASLHADPRWDRLLVRTRLSARVRPEAAFCMIRLDAEGSDQSAMRGIS
jgi:TolB-like protein/DNA-binding winged helix-turn-helix (wHTH) protein/tetratricopeptide (TPR) repeat protein